MSLKKFRKRLKALFENPQLAASMRMDLARAAPEHESVSTRDLTEYRASAMERGIVNGVQSWFVKPWPLERKREESSTKDCSYVRN
jgi:hypothetical protein